MQPTRPPSGLTKQQEIERYYFEQFQKAYSIPAGIVKYCDKPDVRIMGRDRTIGIEVTNFYVRGDSPDSEQVQRPRRARAIAKAHDIHQRSGGPNISITFCFDNDCPIRDEDNLAQRIAVMAQRIATHDNGSIWRNLYPEIPELQFVFLNARELQYSDEPDPNFPNGAPEVSDLPAWFEYRNRREARALRAGIYKPLSDPGTFRLIHSHGFEAMSVTRLEEIVRDKEAKVKGYASCGAYWLLIVVDFMNFGQEQDIQRPHGVAIKSDTFERIIVFRTGFEHVVEVSVDNSGRS